MTIKSIITGLLVFLIAVVLIGMVLPIFEKVKIGGPPKVKLEIANVIWALKGYESEYAALPPGENSNVVKVLSGDNPKKIVFLNYRRTNEHPDEIVDPWLTPLQIQFFQQTNFVIRSAGKDKVFGNADDIVFNSISNDFVKP